MGASPAKKSIRFTHWAKILIRRALFFFCGLSVYLNFYAKNPEAYPNFRADFWETYPNFGPKFWKLDTNFCPGRRRRPHKLFRAREARPIFFLTFFGPPKAARRKIWAAEGGPKQKITFLTGFGPTFWETQTFFDTQTFCDMQTFSPMFGDRTQTLA